MTRVVVDATLRSKLHDLTEPLELCDESGRVVARFTPACDATHFVSLDPRASDEELLHRSQSKEKT